MSASTGFKKIYVAVIMMLSIITMGIYPFIWFLRRLPAFNEISSSSKLRIPRNLSIISLAAAVLRIILSFVVEVVPGNISSYSPQFFVNAVRMGLGLVALLGLISMSLKAVDILRAHSISTASSHGFSKFIAFIFTVFYLQFKINRIPNLLIK